MDTNTITVNLAEKAYLAFHLLVAMKWYAAMDPSEVLDVADHDDIDALRAAGTEIKRHRVSPFIHA